MNIQEKTQPAIDTISHTHPIKGPETSTYPAASRLSGPAGDKVYIIPTIYPTAPPATKYPLAALLQSPYPAYEHIPTLYPNGTAYPGYPGQGSPSELSCNRYFYLHDHNKNVVGLVDEAGDLALHYEYDPYGRHVEIRHKERVNNPLRWSSEYWDEELGLSFYNYRCYNPLDGRWLSRDPIEESGGVNLYGFVENDPISKVDLLGLDGQIYETKEEAFSAAAVMVVETMEKKFRSDCFNTQKNSPIGSMAAATMKEHGTVVCCSSKDSKFYIQSPNEGVGDTMGLIF